MITIMDVAESRGVKIDDDGGVRAQEFERVDLPVMGGCCVCGATVSPYNAYPGKNGKLHCKDDIGDKGFKAVEEFEKAYADELDWQAERASSYYGQ